MAAGRPLSHRVAEAFVANPSSVDLATVNVQCRPCIQHRGGPAGFLQVLDVHTLALVDYTGNMQCISLRFDAVSVQLALDQRDPRIHALEIELAALRHTAGKAA